jgi:hypothetical protein
MLFFEKVVSLFIFKGGPAIRTRIIIAFKTHKTGRFKSCAIHGHAGGKFEAAAFTFDVKHGHNYAFFSPVSDMRLRLHKICGLPWKT